MKIKFKTLISVLSMVGGLLTACDDKYRSRFSDPQNIANRLEKHLLDALGKAGINSRQEHQIREITRLISQDGLQTNQEFAARKGIMTAELFSDNPDLEKLHRLADEKGNALSDFTHRTLERLTAINSLLTPSQLAELRRRFDEAHGGC